MQRNGALCELLKHVHNTVRSVIRSKRCTFIFLYVLSKVFDCYPLPSKFYYYYITMMHSQGNARNM